MLTEHDKLVALCSEPGNHAYPASSSPKRVFHLFGNCTCIRGRVSSLFHAEDMLKINWDLKELSGRGFRAKHDEQ